MTGSRKNINDFPVEILEKIFSYLTVSEKFQYEHVCKHWQQNLFSSIRRLAFTQFHDVTCHTPNHLSSKRDELPITINKNDQAMDCIISKCGKTLLSFSGYVSEATMLRINECCDKLEGCDMIFSSLQNLRLLFERFGNQLKCVTFYLDLCNEIMTLITLCPNLTTVAFRVSMLPITWFAEEIYDITGISLDLLDMTPETGENLLSVRNLVIGFDYIIKGIIENLPLFSNLERVWLQCAFHIDQSLIMRIMGKSWKRLKSLSIDMNTENFVNFDPLPPNLESLSVALRLSTIELQEHGPIEFSTALPTLKVLNVCLLSFSSNVLSTVLSSIPNCFPSLEVFSLRADSSINLYGVPDEHFTPLLSLTSLKQLTLPQQCHISDELAAKLKDLCSFGEE